MSGIQRHVTSPFDSQRTKLSSPELERARINIFNEGSNNYLCMNNVNCDKTKDNNYNSCRLTVLHSSSELIVLVLQDVNLLFYFTLIPVFEQFFFQ